MRGKLRIGISLAVGLAVAAFVVSQIKGETIGNSALHITLYCAAYILLEMALKMFSKRKEKAKGIEKKTLTALTYLGHVIVVSILVLCIWAGVAYAGDGEIKGAIVLLITGIILAVLEGIKLKNMIS